MSFDPFNIKLYINSKIVGMYYKVWKVENLGNGHKFPRTDTITDTHTYNLKVASVTCLAGQKTIGYQMC